MKLNYKRGDYVRHKERPDNRKRKVLAVTTHKKSRVLVVDIEVTDKKTGEVKTQRRYLQPENYIKVDE